MVLNGSRMSTSVMNNNNVSSTPPKKKRMCRASRSLEDFSKVVCSNGTLRRASATQAWNKHPLPKGRKHSELSKEDDEFEEEFRKGCFVGGGEDCTWLSDPDCLSMYSFFDQYFINEWLASLINKWGKSVRSVILDSDLFLKENLGEDEASTWLVAPLEDSVSSLSLCEDSGKSLSQFSRDVDAETRDDLDGEFYHWISNTENDDLKSIQSDGTNSTSLPRSSSASSYFTELMMAEQLDFSPDVVLATAGFKDEEKEPIFWPLQGKFESSAEETMKYLSMSPLRDVKVRTTNPRTSIHRKFDQGGGTRRKLQFESPGTSSCKSSALASAGKTSLCRRSKTTTQLSHNPKKTNKVVPAVMEETVITPKTSSGSEMDLLGDEDFSSSYAIESPIEKLLGLSEFDGHEGVDAEFDGNVFLLD